jgi:hypothetical protein
LCARASFGDRLTLKQYLVANHVIVTTIPGLQNIPDKQLAGLGVKRRSSVRMPYFGAALSYLPGTELILTLTNGMREMVERNSTLRLVKAATRIASISFLNGLASEAHYGRAAHMASRGDAPGFS